MMGMAADAAPRQRFLADIVDLERYPLDEPASPEWHGAVAAARQAMRRDGCCVLRGFVPGQRRKAIRRECAFVAGHAYPAADGGAFVTQDNIPGAFLIRRLYDSSFFRSFLAACLGRSVVYPLGDSRAGLVIRVQPPGTEHPWHFDSSEFTVSLVAQEPEGGGVFEYCPGLSSATEEDLAAVIAVRDGNGGSRVRRLPLRAGDLQLFRGRNSLHRVTQVYGETPRYLVTFSYRDQPGVTGDFLPPRPVPGSG